MDPFAAMQTFVRVVDAGSFSVAARQLNMGQPAVSKAVQRLETHLGVKLLARTTRGLSLTEAGQRYVEVARRALETADEAEVAAREAGAGLTGRLCVSAAVSFGRLQIVPRLPAFLEANPDLTLDVVLDDRPTNLVGEGVDVAFRVGLRPDTGFNGRLIATSRRVVVASPAYLQRRGEPTRPAELADHEAVTLLLPGMNNTWTFAHGEERETAAFTGRLRMTANEGVREAVLAGLGFAIGSVWGFGGEIADGRVKILLPDWTLEPSELWAIIPAGRQASAKARAFIAFLERALRQSARDDPG